MALPSSGSMTLAMLQAEFGGPSPISLGNYYRGGPYVPDGPAVNAGIPASGPLSLSQFYGATKALPVSSFGGVLDATVFSTNGCGCSVTFGVDGNVTGASTGPASTTFSNGAAGDIWYSPATGAPGNSYYVYASLSSGTAPSTGTMNTWLQLNTPRTWSVASGTGGTVSMKTSTINFSIAPTPGGAAVCSGSFTLRAYREI